LDEVKQPRKDLADCAYLKTNYRAKRAAPSLLRKFLVFEKKKGVIFKNL